MRPRSNRSCNTVLLLLAIVCARPVPAHHSVAMFDTDTPLRVRGTVASVSFANPHSVIYIDEVTSDGSTLRWAVENSGTLAMTRQRGFDEQRLKPGTPVEACGFAPKRSLAELRDAAGADPARPRAPWLQSADRVITGRVLFLPDGPAVHWSHYGPLALCMSTEDIEALDHQLP